MRHKPLVLSPRVPFAVIMSAALALAISACGGGGGGGGGGGNNGCVDRVVPPGNPALATVTGYVFDTAGNPVNNVPVTMIVSGGSNVNTTTDSCGRFVATNVPLTVTTFMVSSPNPVAYYNYANYKGNLYDLINCALPLPALKAGTNNAPYTQIQMYLGGANPPPPPPAGGCPA